MRIPLTLFLILIWTFLILAPLNAYAEEVDYPYADFQLQDIYQIAVSYTHLTLPTKA